MRKLARTALLLLTLGVLMGCTAMLLGGTSGGESYPSAAAAPSGAESGEDDYPLLAGSSAQLVDELGRYQDAGMDELLVPDFNLPRGSEKLDRLDRFFEEVAVHFRAGDPPSSA